MDIFGWFYVIEGEYYSRADCCYSNERNFLHISSYFSVVYFQFSFLHSALTATSRSKVSTELYSLHAYRCALGWPQ